MGYDLNLQRHVSFTMLLNPGVSFGLGSTGYSLPNKLTLSQLVTFRSRCTLSRGNKKKQESRCSHKHVNLWQALFHSKASLTHLFKVSIWNGSNTVTMKVFIYPNKNSFRIERYRAHSIHCRNLNRNLQKMHMYSSFIYLQNEWSIGSWDNFLSFLQRCLCVGLQGRAVFLLISSAVFELVFHVTWILMTVFCNHFFDKWPEAQVASWQVTAISQQMLNPE